MIVNRTPIRTSVNYGINEVDIQDLKIHSKVVEFNNLTILGDSSKFDIYTNDDNNQVNRKDLVYGNGKELEEEVYEKANQNIKIGVNNSGTLNLEFELDDENKCLIDNINIISNSKKQATIVIKYGSDDAQEYYHNGIIRVDAKENSRINIIVINLLNEKTNNFLSIENILGQDAIVNYTIVDFGGKSSISNYYSNLIGQRSKANINTIYLGNTEQLFDLNYIAELRGEKTDVNIEVQGALKDFAKKNFKGTIDFKKGSKKSTGNENEYCMLLSDKAKSKALPMLLCTEEDVEGNHSSAAGKVDKESLFYIMSRGISYRDAMKLIVKAKFNKILETIKDENLKDEILKEIDTKLD